MKIITRIYKEIKGAFSVKIDFSARTVAVYSVHKQSGKSTVARELAGFFQIEGQKTLLVDFTLGKSGFLENHPPGKPDLSGWIRDIEKKLRVAPWHEIEYRPEEILEYVHVNATGLSMLSCAPCKFPERMLEAAGVILNSLAKCGYQEIVFDLNSEVRDYVITVLSAVDTVLLVTDTYRYDVEEVKMVMDRLREANCRMEHFKVVFNKKPSFFDESPVQIAEEFNLPMTGSLPDYPKLAKNHSHHFDSVNEYSQAMRKLVSML